jgi:hypothetical protein
MTSLNCRIAPIFDQHLRYHQAYPQKLGKALGGPKYTSLGSQNGGQPALGQILRGLLLAGFLERFQRGLGVP